MTNDELVTSTLDRLRRKANQAWENAGLARQDRDSEDEKRWTAEANRIDAAIGKR